MKKAIFYGIFLFGMMLTLSNCTTHQQYITNKESSLDNVDRAKGNEKITDQTIPNNKTLPIFSKIQNKLRQKNKEGKDIPYSFISSICGTSRAAQLNFLNFLNTAPGIAKLNAIQQCNIQFSHISSILHRSGAQAREAFGTLFNMLFTKKGNNYVKSPQLEALTSTKGVRLVHISSILHGSGAKAGKAFDDLFNKLFTTKKGNNYVKSPQLKALTSKEGVKLVHISSILHGSGAQAREAFGTLFNKLFTKKGNNYVKSPQLEALTSEEDAKFVYISSILHGSGAKVGKAFDDLFNKLFTKKGNNYVKSPQLKALTSKEGVKLVHIFSILHSSGAKAGKAFDNLCKVLADTTLKEKLVLAVKCYQKDFDPLAKVDQLRVSKQARNLLLHALSEGEQLEHKDKLYYLADNDEYNLSLEPYQNSFSKFYKEHYIRKKNYNTDIIKKAPVGNEDPRSALHGQDKVIATKAIQKYTVLGIYTGTILADNEEDRNIELDWLVRNKYGGTSKMNDYSFAIRLKEESLYLSSYGRGNLLMKINAHSTYNTNEAHQYEANVSADQCRYGSGIPFIMFSACKDIKAGEEILIDYGEKYWKDYQSDATDLNDHSAPVYSNYVKHKKVLHPVESPIGFIQFLKSQAAYKELYAKLTHPPYNDLNLKKKDPIDISKEDRYMQVVKIDQPINSIRNKNNTSRRLIYSEKTKEEVKDSDRASNKRKAKDTLDSNPIKRKVQAGPITPVKKVSIEDSDKEN